jgi:hypothetical protein
VEKILGDCVREADLQKDDESYRQNIHTLKQVALLWGEVHHGLLFLWGEARSYSGGGTREMLDAFPRELDFPGEDAFGRKAREVHDDVAEAEEEEAGDSLRGLSQRTLPYH